MSAARKHEMARLAEEDTRRFYCSPRDNLLALDLALQVEDDMAKAQSLALAILDWAVRESDECPKRKLEQESQAAFRERGR